MSKIKTRCSITKSIDRLEMEQVEDDGVLVTIFYKHFYLTNAREIKATVRITKSQMEVALGYEPTGITCYMFEVNVLFGLGVKNLDWKMMKDVPDEYHTSHPEINDNPLALSRAPGRVFWVAEGFRD